MFHYQHYDEEYTFTFQHLENITNERIVLDLNQLSAAVYYLYLEAGYDRIVKRIVKIKE